MKRLVFITPIALALAACEGAPDDGAPAEAGTFVAFTRDFAPYDSWTRFEVDSPPVGPIHTNGPRVVHINALAPAGATVYPIGTVIVKTMQGGDIFAMVKRGGAYNVKGAVGWEFFELKQLESGLAIVWRGIAPPSGACYGAIAGGACNDCHGASPHTDHVLTPALRLGAH